MLTTLLLFSLLFALTSSYSPKECNATYYRLDLLRENSTSFLVHGLWIEQCAQCKQCGYPSMCARCQFNIYTLKPLFNALRANWFPGVDPRNNSLLMHEWCKHGTCTNMTQLDYFNKTLALYTELKQRDLLSLCDLSQNECSFSVDANFTIANETASFMQKTTFSTRRQSYKLDMP